MPAADHEAAERLLEGEEAGAPERVALLPERLAGCPRAAAAGTARRRRPRVPPSQSAIPSRKTRRAGAHSRTSGSQALLRDDQRLLDVRPLRRRGRRRAGAGAAPRGSAPRSALCSRVACVRGCGRSMSTIAWIRPGRGRHHDDAGREEDRLGDRVRDEDDRRARCRPRSAAARRSAARASSRRARRTARPSAAAAARTRARARSRRAAASRRRAATDGASRSP